MHLKCLTRPDGRAGQRHKLPRVDGEDPADRPVGLDRGRYARRPQAAKGLVPKTHRVLTTHLVTCELVGRGDGRQAHGLTDRQSREFLYPSVAPSSSRLNVIQEDPGMGRRDSHLGRAHQSADWPRSRRSSASEAVVQPPVQDAARPLWSTDSPAETLRRWARSSDRDAARAAIARLTARHLEETGQGLPLAGEDLSGLDLRRFDLRRANLNRAAMHGVRADEADLTAAALICTGLERASFKGAVLAGAYVHSLAAQVTCFDDADLSGLVDGTGALFHGCSMVGARLTDAVLAGTTLYQCTLTDADLTGARLQGSTINECQADNACFRGAEVSQLTITKTRLDGATFAGAHGEGLVLQRLTGADGLDLSRARVPNLRLCHARSPNLDITDIDATDADWSDVTAPGLRATGARLSGARIRRCDLTQAELQRAALDHATLRHVSLDDADLRQVSAENATWVECRLAGANLRQLSGRCLTWRDVEAPDVDLTGAYLYRAMITGDPPRTMVLRRAKLGDAVLVQAYVAADLTEADLSNAKLAYGRLNQSDFTRTRLSGASVYGGSLVKANLRGAAVDGLRGPAFVDRCPGLLDGLANRSDDNAGAFYRFARGLAALLAEQKHGST